jgi:hypothetical protein
VFGVLFCAGSEFYSYYLYSENLSLGALKFELECFFVLVGVLVGLSMKAGSFLGQSESHAGRDAPTCFLCGSTISFSCKGVWIMCIII